MGDISITATTSSMPEQVKLVTAQLFEAYLACPTKCYLQSIGELAIGNDFLVWSKARRESYRLNGIQRLKENHPHAVDVNEVHSGHWKHALWDMAFNQNVKTQNCEVSPDAIQRIPLDETNKSSQFVPIKFIKNNKLSSSDKLIAGFEALTLSRITGSKVSISKIIHGDKRTTFKVQENTLSRVVNKTIGLVANLLSASSPPDLILNRHCYECCFQSNCRKRAIEKDDLSLLANLSAKERAQLNGKGIFTVHQLSYTFRPRKRPKRLAGKPEKYHHALKALAIREKKIYIIGSPRLKIDGTPVFIDVEGLPDRDFYYLIGILSGSPENQVQHSFWADDVPDEMRIWTDFLNILSRIEAPVLVHYGSFETTFLKKCVIDMEDRRRILQQEKPSRLQSTCCPLFTVIFISLCITTA